MATRERGNPQLGFRFEPPQAPARRVWTVAELVGEVRSHIEREYADLWVEGEISNLRTAPSGHIYFTLKDGDAQLPAILFRRQASLLRFRPEDGLQVLLRGRVSVYEQRGQMQLVAEFLEPVGAGSLQVAFEQLKGRLQQEGLFDAERKKPLPAFPRCVGIVTSPSGAVIRDFLNVAGRRHAALDVLLFPAVVQGASAVTEVCAGIAYFNHARTVDVIVIARGGGSLEDLAPFNSEGLARAIAGSGLPVVSAIGHETDFTIADFVADLRAPTPSAAAELITAAQHKIEERIDEMGQRLVRASRYRMMQARERFSRLATDTLASRFRDLLNRRQQRLDEIRFRMDAALRLQSRERSDKLQRLTMAVMRRDPIDRLAFARQRLSALDTRIVHAEEVALRTAHHRQSALAMQLNALSPLNVLGRGYALVYAEGGALVRDTEQLHEGHQVRTRVANGSFASRITEIDMEKEA